MIPRLPSFLALRLGLAVMAAGQGASELQRRMAERLPQLDELRARQVVGENNRGYVEVRGEAETGVQRLVAEENGDREAVYELIAHETGSSPETVGRARARQIAAQSRPGVWLQDASGRWYRK
jgi:uncharacterized protein